MFNWTDDDSEDTPAPLDLARDLGRGKPAHRGDVMGVADALDEAGMYDKRRFGNPPLADEHLFKAIERFQDGQGLEVDGLMKPGGPTVTRLNAVLGRRARGDDADARSDQGPDVGPIAAPVRARDDDDPTFAELFRAQRETGAPEGFGPAFDIFAPDAPAPQLAQASRSNPRPQRPGVDGRIDEAIAIERRKRPARRYQEPGSRGQHPSPPPPRPGRGWPSFRGNDNYGEAPYWDALAEHPAIGSRMREALEFTYHAEGAGEPDPQNNASGGITPQTLETVRRRGTFPQDLEFVRRGRPEDLLPGQQLAIHLYVINETLQPAGQARGIDGLQVIEEIGNRPQRGAREVSMAIVDSIIRSGGPRARQDIQRAINQVIGQLGDRVPPGLARLPGDADRFGPATLSAITTLIDAGHAGALRRTILDQYQRRARDPGDGPRIQALRDLDLPPIRPNQR